MVVQSSVKNESNCIIYLPDFSSEIEVSNGNISSATKYFFEDIYDSYIDSYVFETSVYTYCREIEGGYVIYLAFLGFLFICVLSLFITLICARKYRLLLYSRIKNKEDKKINNQPPSIPHDLPPESQDNQNIHK